MRIPLDPNKPKKISLKKGRGRGRGRGTTALGTQKKPAAKVKDEDLDVEEEPIDGEALEGDAEEGEEEEEQVGDSCITALSCLLSRHITDKTVIYIYHTACIHACISMDAWIHA